MNDSLNPKICYFCDKASAKKYVLNPQTKVLNEIFLTALYAGQNYPVCSVCANSWDIELNKINTDWKKLIDKLFESMVVKKGVLIADGENKPS